MPVYIKNIFERWVISDFSALLKSFSSIWIPLTSLPSVRSFPYASKKASTVATDLKSLYPAFASNPKRTWSTFVDFLVIFDQFDYSLTEIAKHAGVSYSTIQLIWGDLEKTGIVKQSRIVGKAKMYKINKDNPVVKEFIKFYWGVIKAATKIKIEARQKVYVWLKLLIEISLEKISEKK